MDLQVGSSGQITDGSVTNPRRPLITRMRFQLLGGLVIAVLVPGLIRWGPKEFYVAISQDWASFGSFEYSLIGSAIAVVLGYSAFRQVATYPGANPIVYPVPVFAVVFGILIVLFFFFRLDYSRYQIFMSFLVSVGWFSSISLIAEGHVKIRLAIVPGGDLRKIASHPGIIWILLDNPGAQLTPCDGIVADLRHNFPQRWQKFLARAALSGQPIFHVKQLAESLTGRVEIEHLSENTFGAVVPHSIYVRIKYFADFFTALALLPLAMCAIAVCAVLIKLDSAGPVFFIQDRVGYGGRIFKLYKLRTMFTDAEPDSVTRAGDQRITGIGNYLRAYRLDEIPQIINIVKGEMSWIGPRPEALELSAWYESELPFYPYRHTIRPGISGWAQVHQGHVADVPEVSHKLNYDFFYIKNLSFWIDLLIIFKTIKTVATRFGAR